LGTKKKKNGPRFGLENPEGLDESTLPRKKQSYTVQGVKSGNFHPPHSREGDFLRGGWVAQRLYACQRPGALTTRSNSRNNTLRGLGNSYKTETEGARGKLWGY